MTPHFRGRTDQNTSIISHCDFLSDKLLGERELRVMDLANDKHHDLVHGRRVP